MEVAGIEPASLSLVAKASPGASADLDLDFSSLSGKLRVVQSGKISPSNPGRFRGVSSLSDTASQGVSEP